MRPDTLVETECTTVPATPRDILSFAWQISKGMVYLSDIKVRSPLTLSIVLEKLFAYHMPDGLTIQER
jgi:hypothetical protein